MQTLTTKELIIYRNGGFSKKRRKAIESFLTLNPHYQKVLKGIIELDKNSLESPEKFLERTHLEMRNRIFSK